MSPKRIQRTEEWKPSKDAVWVGPRSKFNNPFGTPQGWSTGSRQLVSDHFKQWLTMPLVWRRKPGIGWTWVAPGGHESFIGTPYADRQVFLENLPALRGKDLVCRCPISQPCHADILLELANVYGPLLGFRQHGFVGSAA
ncbi:DUF4326 domain-containing protein [Paenarthrobacter sp. R1]|uniref:DUF4326 domain-containing protein n=1 Tax=Paenarthrobacter sp. R1 TaxID=3049085 RepID=UPI003317A39E